MFGARFNRPGHATLFIKEYMVPTTFGMASKHFEHFFKVKAGIEWAQRLDEVKAEEDAFLYMPPMQGEPRGVMPFLWKEPQLEDNGHNDKTDERDSQ